MKIFIYIFFFLIGISIGLLLIVCNVPEGKVEGTVKSVIDDRGVIWVRFDMEYPEKRKDYGAFFRHTDKFKIKEGHKYRIYFQGNAIGIYPEITGAVIID